MQAVAGRGARRAHRRAALFAHRRGYSGEPFPISSRRLRPAGRDRRRTADHARRPRAAVQRAAAAAQPQRASRPSCSPNFPAHLRAYDLLARRRRGFARRAVRRAPRAARSVRRAARRCRASICRRSCLSRPGRSWRARAHDPAAAGAGADADAVEGVMLKRARLRSICPAGRRGRGGNGSAIPSWSMPC